MDFVEACVHLNLPECIDDEEGQHSEEFKRELRLRIKR